MSEPEVDSDRHDPARPVAPRRFVADWEYATSYIQFFQVRMPERLHTWLDQRAKQEQKTMEVLLTQILEQAVSTRREMLDGGAKTDGT